MGTGSPPLKKVQVFSFLLVLAEGFAAIFTSLKYEFILVVVVLDLKPIKICASKYWLVRERSPLPHPECGAFTCVTAAGQIDESLYLRGFDGVPEPDEVSAAKQRLFHLGSSTSSPFPPVLIPSSLCQAHHLSPLKSSHHFLFLLFPSPYVRSHLYVLLVFFAHLSCGFLTCKAPH